MAVVSKDELLKQIKNIIGDNTSDEALALIENASDTLDEQAKGGNTEELTKQIAVLKKEKEDVEKMWREKYRERFFSGVNTSTEDNNDDGNNDNESGEEESEPKTFEDLFTNE